MNHEFEWRNEMRKLGGPVAPARDLWPAIGARIADAPQSATAGPRRRFAAWVALAATIVVAVGAGTAAYRWQSREPATVTPAVVQVAAPGSANATKGAATTTADLPRTALEWAIPADPQLAATAQNLDDASSRLQEALEQRPDAVFLVGLLNRTNAQRLRLLRKSPPYAD